MNASRGGGQVAEVRAATLAAGEPRWILAQCRGIASGFPAGRYPRTPISATHGTTTSTARTTRRVMASSRKHRGAEQQREQRGAGDDRGHHDQPAVHQGRVEHEHRSAEDGAGDQKPLHAFRRDRPEGGSPRSRLVGEREHEGHAVGDERDEERTRDLLQGRSSRTHGRGCARAPLRSAEGGRRAAMSARTDRARRSGSRRPRFRRCRPRPPKSGSPRAA